MSHLDHRCPWSPRRGLAGLDGLAADTGDSLQIDGHDNSVLINDDLGGKGLNRISWQVFRSHRYHSADRSGTACTRLHLKSGFQILGKSEPGYFEYLRVQLS